MKFDLLTENDKVTKYHDDFLKLTGKPIITLLINSYFSFRSSFKSLENNSNFQKIVKTF